MATYANTIEYAANRTYGNVAYDLEWYGGTAVPQEYPGAYEEPEVREQVKTRTKVKTKVKVEEKQRVSAFGAVGCVVIAVLAVLLLLAYIQLAEISAETVEIQDQIEELNNENTRLKSEFEMTFNMSQVKDYAIKVLGMVEPGADQITVLNMGTTDKAEVIHTTNVTDVSAIESVSVFLTSVLEYFR